MRLEEYLSQHPKKHLIIDFDMTLVELVWPNDIFDTLKRYLGTVDANLASKQQEIGYEYFNELINKYGHQVKDDLSVIYREAESSRLDEVKTVNKPLFDFIKLNGDKYNFYVWSNNQRQTVEAILKKFSFDNLFTKVITATDVYLFKPDIEGFNKIFDPNVHKKADFLMIGDSPNDKKAAVNSGIEFFHCSI